jgi:hypothetical protein
MGLAALGFGKNQRRVAAIRRRLRCEQPAVCHTCIAFRDGRGHQTLGPEPFLALLPAHRTCYPNHLQRACSNLGAIALALEHGIWLLAPALQR